ncbi:tripartite tricarboxylate transporter substrate binding protein [Roseiarcaceae bacterium H3SJ34-1]|uniref:Bug family tripartite tricarboxylate transporter substrate binding protein n=1 Tax=Terripilifer ovatus TaxID=3032367 RepID=UPI003AB96DA6|nr:tripartite tricarboxylate transporter substrate binding protein [Roseiarcaceae bacterium H3SJ34-1]
MRRSVLGLLAFALVVQVSAAAMAETFPTRPVRFIVPNPPGGSNDAAARILAEALTEIWPHPVVVENKSGGGGNIGAKAAAIAPADGYTYLVSSPGPITINPSLYRKLSFDPAKDFTPIALVATVPIVLIVNPKLPAATVSELLDLAKKQTDELNYASSGIGSTHHLSAELFKKMTGVKLKHVPYRGAAPAMNDVIAGHVPILFDNLPTVIPQVQAGNVRGLAVASAKRLNSLPDVPTFEEAGLAGFEVSSWFGVLAPAGTPADIVAQVTADIKRVMSTPSLRKSFEETGAEIGTLFGPDFGRFMTQETEKWGDVIRSSGTPIME